MVSSPFETVQGFVLHSRPVGESQHLITLLTKEHSKLRCLFKGPPPELARQFEMKVKRADDLVSASSFRYVDPVLVHTPVAKFFLLYVNELSYCLALTDVNDSLFYGQYMATLIHLNEPATLQFALRFFEFALLESLGQGIDFNTCANGNDIQSHGHYRFIAGEGFVETSSPAYPGSLIRAAGQLKKQAPGALALARQCSKAQIEFLLNGKSLISRQWPLPQRRLR